jgi:hypothetical protein
MQGSIFIWRLPVQALNECSAVRTLDPTWTQLAANQTPSDALHLITRFIPGLEPVACAQVA